VAVWLRVSPRLTCHRYATCLATMPIVASFTLRLTVGQSVCLCCRAPSPIRAPSLTRGLVWSVFCQSWSKVFFYMCIYICIYIRIYLTFCMFGICYMCSVYKPYFSPGSVQQIMLYWLWLKLIVFGLYTLRSTGDFAQLQLGRCMRSLGIFVSEEWRLRGCYPVWLL
jgi:hypothetical protein